MIDISAILSKCQWLPFKWDLQKAKFALVLPLSKGMPFILALISKKKVKYYLQTLWNHAE